MISKLFEAMFAQFTPKYPRGYTGRHRAAAAVAGAARSRPARSKAIAGTELAV